MPSSQRWFLAQRCPRVLLPRRRLIRQLRQLNQRLIQWLNHSGASFSGHLKGKASVEAQLADCIKALHQSEAQFRCLFEVADIGVAILSLDGCFLRVNPALCAMLGYSETALLSLSWSDLADSSVPPAVPPEAKCSQHEGFYRHQQGHRLWVRVKLSRLDDEQGQPLYYIAQLQDLCRAQQAELERSKQVAEAAEQAKRDFLSSINHDLRTPLNAILGYGQLMAKDAQTQQQQAQIDIINRNGKYLLQLLDDILARSKVEVTQLRRDHLGVSNLEQSPGFCCKEPYCKESHCKESHRELPLAAADSAESGNASLPLHQPPLHQPPLHQPLEPTAYRILVVDDTAVNRMLMQHWLEQTGFEVQQAQNGQAAVEQAILFRPSLIWMDMRMPVMDGLAAMQLIRKAAAEANLEAQAGEAEWQPKIIALTAAAFDAERQQILAAGFDDFVSKPCSKTVVFDKIAQHLSLNLPLNSLPTVCAQGLALPQAGDAQPFAMMPADWVAQLNHAARSANEPLIFQLLEALPPDCRDLKNWVTQLVQDFQLGQLICLTQPEPSKTLEPSQPSQPFL